MKVYWALQSQMLDNDEGSDSSPSSAMPPACSFLIGAQIELAAEFLTLGARIMGWWV